MGRIRGLILLFASLSAGAAMAGEGAGKPTVVHGGAAFSRDGANLAVTTATDRTIIHWNHFGVPAGSLTRFVQPGANSATLNRVTGALPSRVDGTLASNGAVYLVNPSGVVVGSRGVVRADGGFVASTLDLLDTDFLNGGPGRAGTMHFSGDPDAGDIRAHGLIESAKGDVFLIGRRVEQAGTVRAPMGTAGLAAAGGGDVVIRPAGTAGGRIEIVARETSFADGVGVENAGVIEAASAELRAHGDAYRLAVNNTGLIDARGVVTTPEGRIFLTATGAGGKAAGAVANAGTLRAVDADGSGGSVAVTGGSVTLKAGSLVDVSATSGDGGTAKIGGEWQGGANLSSEERSASLPSAAMTTVAAGAVIRADAGDKGHGGTVAVWADGTTGYAGHLSARGGDLGGDGGAVEVSGKGTLRFEGTVDTSAAKGAAGLLLLDPADITISAGTGGNILNVTTLTSALASNNVVVFTNGTDPLAGNGNIFVDSDVEWSPTANTSLTLLAWNNIVVRANLRNFVSSLDPASATANQSKGNLTLVAGWNGTTGWSGGGMYANGTPTLPAAPTTQAQLSSATWFGNTADRTASGIGGVNYAGSIVLDAAARAVNVGSRNGTTTLFGNNITLRGGASADYYAHVGYKAAREVTAATTQAASGGIEVVTRSGGVRLTAGTEVNAYTQIGHGGGFYSNNAGVVSGYWANADHADLRLLSSGGLELAAGPSWNTYAQFGHGGAVFTGNGGNTSSLLRVNASEVSLTLDVLGDVSLSGNPEHSNSFAQMGHGGGSYNNALSSAEMSVTANGSPVVVSIGGALDLAGGSGTDVGVNGFARVGHGGGVYTGTTAEASLTLSASESLLDVRVVKSLRLTGGDDAIGMYAQLGHGGVANTSQTGTTVRLTVTAERADVQVDAGGDLILEGGAGEGSNNFALVGHGGATRALANTTGPTRLTVTASESEITVEVGRDLLLSGGYGWNTYAQVGHSGTTYSSSRQAEGATTATLTANEAALSIDVKGRISLAGNMTHTNSYAQIGHGGGHYSYTGVDAKVESAESELLVSAGSAISLAGGAEEDAVGVNAYVQIGHGGAIYLYPGAAVAATLTVMADDSALDVRMPGALSLEAGSGSGNYARLGHGGRCIIPAAAALWTWRRPGRASRRRRAARCRLSAAPATMPMPRSATAADYT